MTPERILQLAWGATRRVVPSHLAAWRERVGIARILLRSGASPEATDDEGRTPLGLAEERGYFEVADLLRESAENEGTGR